MHHLPPASTPQAPVAAASVAVASALADVSSPHLQSSRPSLNSTAAVGVAHAVSALSGPAAAEDDADPNSERASKREPWSDAEEALFDALLPKCQKGTLLISACHDNL